MISDTVLLPWEYKIAFQPLAPINHSTRPHKTHQGKLFRVIPVIYPSRVAQAQPVESPLTNNKEMCANPLVGAWLSVAKSVSALKWL